MPAEECAIGMKNKDLVAPLLSTLLIFTAWFLTIYFGQGLADIPSIRYVIIPLVWSCVFIYLSSKNYLYLATIAYLVFVFTLFADIFNFTNTYGVIQVAYTSLCLLAVFSFIYLYQEVFKTRPGIASLLSSCGVLVLCIAPLFYLGYTISFDAPTDKVVFYAIMQSNFGEAIEFVAEYISPVWLAVILLLAAAVAAIFIKQQKISRTKIETSLLYFLILTFATLTFSNQDNLRLYAYAKNSMLEYHTEMALFDETQRKLKNAELKFRASKTGREETYVIVIGESLNRNNMGLYGYFRDTTPLLSAKAQRGDLLPFTNAYSSHTHTMEVLSQALTEANQHNGKSYYESLSIINLLQQLNFETY